MSRKNKKSQKIGTPCRSVTNELNYGINVTKLYQKLVTDITYLSFESNIIYLSTIMDLHNRKIIAYSISDKQNHSSVLNTLAQLPVITKYTILHSNKLSIYTSYHYQTATINMRISLTINSQQPNMLFFTLL